MNATDLSPLKIPGEVSLFHTVNLPDEEVALPLEAGRSIKLLLWFMLTAPLGALGALMLFGCVVGVSQWISEGAQAPALRELFIWTLMFAMSIVLGGLFGGGAVTALLDYLRANPLIIVDDKGVLDRRVSARRIDWTEVACAELLYKRYGVAAVRFKLRHLVSSRKNPFRPGTTGLFWPRFRANDLLHISVSFLNIRPYILAQSMITLVKQHGGEVKTQSQFDF